MAEAPGWPHRTLLSDSLSEGEDQEAEGRPAGMALVYAPRDSQLAAWAGSPACGSSRLWSGEEWKAGRLEPGASRKPWWRRPRCSQAPPVREGGQPRLSARGPPSLWCLRWTCLASSCFHQEPAQCPPRESEVN